MTSTMTSQKDFQKDSQKFNLYNFITQDLKLNAENINYYEAPPEVTYEMLDNIFKDDLDYQFTLNKNNGVKNIEKNINFLWTPYAKIMFPKNNFGIYYTKDQVDKIFQLKETDNSFSPIVFIESKDQSNIPKLPDLPDELRLDIKYSKLLSKKEFNNIFFKKYTNYPNNNNEGIVNNFPTGGYMKLKRKTTRSIKLHKRKLSKNKVQKGGVVLPNLDIVPVNYPNFYCLELYNYIEHAGGNATNMFGMAIPRNNNRMQLLQQFGHLMYNREIKIIIDLHSCGTRLHPRMGMPFGFEQCNETGDINCERETWEFLKKLHPANIVDNDIMFYNDEQHIGIQDMTSGTILAWQSLIRINVDIMPPNAKKFAIHCQAGYGRTGSVMLLYILKSILIVAHLQRPFFALADSAALYNFLVMQLYNAGANDFQVREVFDIRNDVHAGRLISRINYIILSIAYINNLFGVNFYLYNLNHIPGLAVNMNNLFVPKVGQIQAADFLNPVDFQNYMQGVALIM